jgi:hypothetical protein
MKYLVDNGWEGHVGEDDEKEMISGRYVAEASSEEL